MIKKLKIGSRDSKLALIQTNWVKAELEKAYPDLEIEVLKIKTQGDKILDVALSKIGDKALFTKELEKELLEENIDLAVHSMKDLPTQLPEGLEIAVTSKREDIRDVVCFSQDAKNRGVKTLADAKTIATSSLRRIAQLKAVYPQTEFVDIRGNLQTRFKKLHDKANGIDAVILAAAGIKRLAEKDLIDEYLDPCQVLPAVGQGALAIEIKSGRQDLAEFLRAVINDESTEKIVKAERAFLRTLEGGCQVPIGVCVLPEADKFKFDAIVLNLDGTEIIKDSFLADLNDLEREAVNLADDFIAKGAKSIIASSPREHSC